MKFSLLLPAILLFLKTNFAQYIPTYIESSAGLNIPELEGGRTELEIADVNNDGNPDILSIGDHGSPYVNTQQHGIMVWFGDGEGNWTVFQTGNFGYGGIAVGDVNNDGLQDVGYAMHHNYSSNDFGDQLIEVALGDGSGMNWIPWDDGLATNGESWGMFGTDFADIDNDGDLDIGVNSFGASSGIHVYFNNGDGTWTQAFGFTGGNSTDDFVFGDVNNDGYPDFAAAHQFGTVYLNDGSGSFTMSDGNLPPAGILGRYGPDLGDVNQDGTDELSFANTSGGVEVWKWSDGNFWSSLSSGLPSSGSFAATQLYDMNSDGFNDLAAFATGFIRIWLGDGTGNWTFASDINIPDNGTFTALRIEGDADHNGFADIALVDEEGSFISYQNHLRFFKESSVADELTVIPVYPFANRIIHINSVQFIKWMSEVPAGSSPNVKLEFSGNDINGPWILISDDLMNNGQFQWIVPDSIASSQVCRIRYTVYTAEDTAAAISPGFFLIPEPPIPVELTYLTVSSVGNSVTLKWQTATERNNSGFEVQRRKSEARGQEAEWKTIGFIPGFGTTTEMKLYSFTDENLSSGIYLYRLKQIDFDGSFEYSMSTEAEIKPPAEFSLSQNYPNPFNPTTKINFSIPNFYLSSGDEGVFVKLIVYDAIGREITTLIEEYKQAGTYEVEFNAAHNSGTDIAGGIYFYQLRAGDFIQTKKMILLR
ncbi:MAG: hypothetical protein Kow0098_19430 [Ignavibacteriaceae bacterium]